MGQLLLDFVICIAPKMEADERKLAEVRFKWAKWLEKSCMCHHAERSFQLWQLWHFD